MQKPITFQKESFLFKYDKIFQAAILQNFHSDFFFFFFFFFELLMFQTDLKNLYNKNFFPS
jgi:hypothetical protein